MFSTSVHSALKCLSMSFYCAYILFVICVTVYYYLRRSCTQLYSMCFTSVSAKHNFQKLFALLPIILLCCDHVVRQMVCKINQMKSHGLFWNKSSDFGSRTIRFLIISMLLVLLELVSHSYFKCVWFRQGLWSIWINIYWPNWRYCINWSLMPILALEWSVFGPYLCHWYC